MKPTDRFYLDKIEPNKSCLLALREIILSQDSHINETLKYGMPCFSFYKSILCYLWTDKKTKEPYILMVNGNYLDHPLLEKGSRSRMKILRINPTDDLQVSVIDDVFQEALNLYTNSKVLLKK